MFLWILLSETQFGTCGAGQEIRIMGYLIDFETNLGHDTLRQNVIRSMRQGCHVSIVIDGTTFSTPPRFAAAYSSSILY